jgi:hypothetical protein
MRRDAEFDAVGIAFERPTAIFDGITLDR